jgi:hypothetical protein
MAKGWRAMPFFRHDSPVRLLADSNRQHGLAIIVTCFAEISINFALLAFNVVFSYRVYGAAAMLAIKLFPSAGKS